jgi:uncharacterized membrane protein YdjX (TVP38/TMEM64 family)
MSDPKQKSKQKPKLSLIIFAILFVCFVAALIIWGRPLLSVFSDSQKAEQLVKDAGPWGPVVFILMQIGQVFFAPIPGQVTGFLGGYLFGTVLGTVYSMIGAAIGFTVVCYQKSVGKI